MKPPLDHALRDVRYAVRGFLRAPLTGVLHVFDPIAYGFTIACIVPACGIAAWLPAHRAGRIEPIATLRHD